jgi:hypothetical protein
MICALIPCILFSSCGQSQIQRGISKKNDAARKINKNFSKIDSIRHIEAKLIDIPQVPLNSKPINSLCSSDPQTIMLGYACSMPCDDIVTFYQHEMERFGWNYAAQFKSSEILLNFNKPNRDCSISIRPGMKNNEIVIFVGIKDSLLI